MDCISSKMSLDCVLPGHVLDFPFLLTFPSHKSRGNTRRAWWFCWNILFWTPSGWSRTCRCWRWAGRTWVEQQAGILGRGGHCLWCPKFHLFKRNFGILAYEGQHSESFLLGWDGKLLVFGLTILKVCRCTTISLFYSPLLCLLKSLQLTKPSLFCRRWIKSFFSHLTPLWSWELARHISD